MKLLLLSLSLVVATTASPALAANNIRQADARVVDGVAGRYQDGTLTPIMEALYKIHGAEWLSAAHRAMRRHTLCFYEPSKCVENQND